MAKITIIEEDKSLSVASAGALQAGCVVIMDKGRANIPVSVESDSDFIAKYGIPNPKKSVTAYSVLSYLQKSSCLVARAIHTAPEGSVETISNRTARFASALVRGKITPAPTTIPDLTWQPERIVEPYIHTDGFGLTQKQINGFQFPQYAREREYKELKVKLISDVTNNNTLIVNDFKGVEQGAQLAFNTADKNSTLYNVVSTIEKDVKLSKIVSDKPVTATANSKLRHVKINKIVSQITTTAVALKGANTITLAGVNGLTSGMSISFSEFEDIYVIQSVDSASKTLTLRQPLATQIPATSRFTLYNRTYTAYDDDTLLLRDVSGTNELLMKSVDLIGDGDIVTFMDGLTNAETEFVIKDKGIYNEQQKQIILDKNLTLSTNSKVFLLTGGDFEPRDVMLVYSDNQGEWGNNVTIEILPSNDYPNNARIIKVYDNGVEVEKYEVTFKSFVDGLGKQLYIEDNINDKSNYIRVKHNTNMVDANGEPVLPLINNYAIWRELPSDVFKPTGKFTTETLTYGELDIKVSDFTGLELGDRLRFGNFLQEYKVTGKSSQQVGTETEYHITIDREIQVDKIANNSIIYKFDSVELKPVQEISQFYSNYATNSNLAISGNNGTLLDCGGNLLSGGHNGSTPDVSDLILCLKDAFANREKINVNILLSGGIYIPAYAQAIDSLIANREDCFAYLSNDPSALDNTDPVTATIQFRSDLNINSSRSALFADWIEVYDPYNKKYIMASVDGVAAALQSVAAQGGIWGLPAAGWEAGSLFGVNRLYYSWSETEREKLLDAQINPCKKFKTRGISVWGNKTLYAQRSFMQSRNVRFILMQMNVEIRDYMESQHWKLQDSDMRAIMVALLKDTFMKYAPVVNQIEVFDKTTPADEDAGLLNIYVGFIPKGIAENIKVTFGVFSNSQGITIS